MALHQAQSAGSDNRARRPRGKPQLDVVAAGQFFCDFAGCKSKQKGFRRPEHLKRHMRTHFEQKRLDCPFFGPGKCKQSFTADRSDNYRVHVKLHALPGKNKRTKYFPEAEIIVAQWAAEKSLKPETGKAIDDVVERSSSRSSRQSTSLPNSKAEMDVDFDFCEL